MKREVIPRNDALPLDAYKPGKGKVDKVTSSMVEPIDVDEGAFVTSKKKHWEMMLLHLQLSEWKMQEWMSLDSDYRVSGQCIVIFSICGGFPLPGKQKTLVCSV